MIYRKAVFWFSFASLVICLLNYFGYDSRNILLFALNPLLNPIVYSEPFRHLVFNFNSSPMNGDSMAIDVYFPAYILHFFSFLLIGAIVDGLMIRILKKQKPPS
ncbi:hypothetical protein [Paenibacillus sp. NFR01]|uniref:hypothetical protein n=1 Tax=Paenibacillus sp. NFR01 TaxID=1566279 RepID=UPI0008AC0C47|nr:hypothetical protein [Paenibacillus sp. NFR01]SET00372.1 hypothetical protein SAMN03159358_0497 [Paenibacillus sp. NFR01]